MEDLHLGLDAVIKDHKHKILLVCEDGQAKEAIMRLSRVGFDNCLRVLRWRILTWQVR